MTENNQLPQAEDYGQVQMLTIGSGVQGQAPTRLRPFLDTLRQKALSRRVYDPSESYRIPRLAVARRFVGRELDLATSAIRNMAALDFAAFGSSQPSSNANFGTAEEQLRRSGCHTGKSLGVKLRPMHLYRLYVTLHLCSAHLPTCLISRHTCC